MSDVAFQLIRVDSFLDDMNRADKFDTALMDGLGNNYKFVLASSTPSNNIEDCIDVDGTLVDEVELINTGNAGDGECALLWSKGINGERTISVASSTVSYSFDEPVDIRAVFLVEIGSGSGYVLAYAINNEAFSVDGNMMCPVDGVVWTIRYED